MNLDGPSIVVLEAETVGVLILGYPLFEFPGDEGQSLTVGYLSPVSTVTFIIFA